MDPDVHAKLTELLQGEVKTTIRHLIDGYRANSLTDGQLRGKIGELSALDLLLDKLRRQDLRHKNEVAKAYQGHNGYGS